MKKPKLKFDSKTGSWMCGGLRDLTGYYIDWFYGETPESAYNAWKRDFNNCY